MTAHFFGGGPRGGSRRHRRAVEDDAAHLDRRRWVFAQAQTGVPPRNFAGLLPPRRSGFGARRRRRSEAVAHCPVSTQQRGAAACVPSGAGAADAQLEGTLGAQSPEILNLIAEALAAAEDILQPYSFGALARSCKVIKEAVKDAKDKLKVEYTAARALVGKCGYTVVDLVEHRPRNLNW